MFKKKSAAPSLQPTKQMFGGLYRTKAEIQSIKKLKRKYKKMEFKKASFGLTYFVLKISLVIAGIAMMKLDPIHFILDIYLYQVVGGVLLAFLAYLELYEYFTRPVEKKTSKKQKNSALGKLQSDYIQN